MSTLMGYFWLKYIIFELKKYREAIFHAARVWCQIWRKANMWVGKWHKEFGKFSTEHTKFSTLGLSLDPFIQNRKCMSLKLKGELCVMKNNTKFEIELTSHFKTDLRSLTNFDRSTKASQKFTF